MILGIVMLMSYTYIELNLEVIEPLPIIYEVENKCEENETKNIRISRRLSK